MAQRLLIAALSMMVAVTSASASVDPRPSSAPPGNPGTLYCMRVDPITGSNVETVQCWTRDEWAEQDVDVDKEWAKNGVRTIG